MLNKRYAAIDQGTTGTRIVIVEENGYIYSPKTISHKQITPINGWVEHDAEEILENIKKCLISGGIVDAIGICHQGESIVAWDSSTGRPIYNAIIWQDMRTESTLAILKKEGYEPLIKEKTGLPLDPYFSASKMGWIMNNVSEAQQLADSGRLRIGTMDSFFMDHLCGEFVTDYSAASRTSLFNIHTLEWDTEICKLFDVPIDCLPTIRETIGELGTYNLDGQSIPVTALIVDQFAGIFGHDCRNSGDTKVTFGTGTFAQALTGNEIPEFGEYGLLPTLCWKFPNEKPIYGLDGGVYNAASAINWIRSLGLFSDFEELDNFPKKSAISRGLAFVPALSGLGCPYWDRSATGIWVGLSLETSRKDMLQSVLEGIALRSAEVILSMDKLSPLGESISIDGGLSKNKYFKQFLSNILNKKLISPLNSEITAIGTALLARKGLGIKGNIDFKTKPDITYPQHINQNEILNKYKNIVSRSRGLR